MKKSLLIIWNQISIFLPFYQYSIFSLSDSSGPVLFTILGNVECCFCKRLNGVSNSTTLPDDKAYKSTSSTQLFISHQPTMQYSIKIHYCFQSMSNSKDSTIVKLPTDHLLNYTISSVANHHTVLIYTSKLGN